MSRARILADYSGSGVTRAKLDFLNSDAIPFFAEVESGTANSSTFLRGDKTWQIADLTPSIVDGGNTTAVTIDSNETVTLAGNLVVSGTQTTVNSTTLTVDDKNIELGSVDTPSDTTADGGGITLKGATDKTFNWVNSTDAWTSSEHINLASGKSIGIGVTAGQASAAQLHLEGTGTGGGDTAVLALSRDWADQSFAAGDIMGKIVWRYGPTTDAAAIRGEVPAGWSGSDHPAKLVFSTTTDGTATLTDRLTISDSGHVLPGADNSYDLGSSSLRWRNIYTTDLHLNNDRGDWTIIEEEEYLSIRNNKNGKMYKFVLEEIK